ncbi:MAG: aspartate 1-decarboxylase [candidate division FCPU426 bacterium]
MLRTFMKAKIHRATVTDANVHYVGSITLDPLLMERADILPYEQVDVLNVSNGNRLTTYAILGKKRGNGQVCLNGAAARLCRKGDIVLVVSYAQLHPEEMPGFRALTLMVDAKNRVKKAVSSRLSMPRRKG